MIKDFEYKGIEFTCSVSTFLPKTMEENSPEIHMVTMRAKNPDIDYVNSVNIAPSLLIPTIESIEQATMAWVDKYLESNRIDAWLETKGFMDYNKYNQYIASKNVDIQQG